MDLRELGRVGLKLLGVWTALTSIAWPLGLLQLLAEPAPEHVTRLSAVLAEVLTALVYGLCTWALLARTEWLLARLLPEERPPRRPFPRSRSSRSPSR